MMNRFLNAAQASSLISNAARIKMLRRAGIQIGRNVTIYAQTFFGSDKCEIGDNAFISIQCLIDGSDWVKIGNGVQLAMGVRLITSSHEVGAVSQRAGTLTQAPITIGDGCWLGASVVVLPGVEIAKGCIIGAGAVVAKSTTPNGLYVGVPAKRIKELEAECAD